jgi:hypothetical protein
MDDPGRYHLDNQSQLREDTQFDRVLHSIDRHRSIFQGNGQAPEKKSKKQINLLTIQKMLEKDLVKKMPIKLKA